MMTLIGRITAAEGRTDLLILIYSYVLLWSSSTGLSDRALDATSGSDTRSDGWNSKRFFASTASTHRATSIPR